MKYFKAYELVDKEVYDKFGEDSLRFFDTRLLETLDWIREELGLPIYINNWKNWKGGIFFDERGLRHNRSDLVKPKKRIYLSGHVLGKAADFDVKGMTAQEVRDWLELNKERLPYPIRIEVGVNWVHIDVATLGKEKLEKF